MEVPQAVGRTVYTVAWLFWTTAWLLHVRKISSMLLFIAKHRPKHAI